MSKQLLKNWLQNDETKKKYLLEVKKEIVNIISNFIIFNIIIVN